MTDLKSGQEQWHIRTLTYRLADAMVIVAGWWMATKSIAPDVSEPRVGHDNYDRPIPFRRRDYGYVP